MFPRTYFAGRYYPPAYFPQSQGEAAETGGGVSASTSLTYRVSATAAIIERVNSTAGLNPR